MRRPLAAALTAAVLAVVVLAALAGCGSGGSSTGGSGGSSSTGAPGSESSVKASARIAREAEAKAPKGASPTLRGVYRAFPPPPKKAMKPAAADAVEAGEAACRGKTPVAVKEEFYAAAKPNLEPQQATMIARIAGFEAEEKTDQGFVAGQLAADTYAATLGEEEVEPGYQGCVYALSLALRKRLAPKK